MLDPAYVAPECQNRPQAMSRASDVYAAGVIAFQVLTGELPFASSTDQHQRASALPTRPDGRRPGFRSRSSTCCGGCARWRRRRVPPAAEALEALADAGRVPARPGDPGSATTTGTCPRAISSPASTRCSGRSAVGRSAPCTRSTTTWRTRTGR